MSIQIGLVNAMNTICDEQITQFNNDSFIPIFQKDGMDNVAKKFLARNLPSGGSSDYAQPKNVIVINPDADEVEGKVYHTFGEAKAYILSLNTTEKFCIELPSGNFSEQITLDEKWLIHGNNTIITAPINSNVIIGQDLIVNPNGVFISDCTILGGFAGYHCESDEEMANLPLYKLSHCRITEFCSDSETEDWFVVLCEYCEIETTRSHNNLIAKGTSIAYPHAVLTLHSTILQFGASAVSSIYCFYSGLRNIGAYSATFINCGQSNKFIEEFGEINVNRLRMTNCFLQTMKSNNNSMENFRVADSNISIVMEGEIYISEFLANNSYVMLRSDEGATITINESWVSPNTVCRVDNITWSATTDHTMCYVMYSTDGGKTMSYDSAEATHYGILKVLPEEFSYGTSYYMWFPMPN